MSFPCINFDVQMLEDVPQITNGVQLSIVQGYMSRFYRLLPWYNLVAIKIFWIVFLRINSWYDYPQWCFRKYGTWVARNPILVLCSSLAVILIFCLGLIRFQVETRPEKVCLNNLVFDTVLLFRSQSSLLKSSVLLGLLDCIVIVPAIGPW